MKSKLLIGLLSLLGFSIAEIGCVPDEYGSPHADFEVKGKVTDESGDPIKGIKVSIRPQEGYYRGRGGSAQTNAEGAYRINEGYWMAGASTVWVVTEDIDGEENGGEFASEKEEIKLENSDFKGGDKNWYQGKAEKTVNFTLEKLISDENEE